MADKLQIKIDGVNRLVMKLRKMAPSKAKRALSGAMNRAAKPIISEARKGAPKRTGIMKKSIGSKLKKYAKGTFLFLIVGARRGFGTAITEEGRKTPRNYNPVNILHLIERGTKSRAARPFLLPAIARTKTKVIQVFKTELAKRVEKELSK